MYLIKMACTHLKNKGTDLELTNGVQGLWTSDRTVWNVVLYISTVLLVHCYISFSDTIQTCIIIIYDCTNYVNNIILQWIVYI